MTAPATNDLDSSAGTAASRPALSVAAILTVVAVGYAIAPTRAPLHGEEGCRSQHGIEMAATGEWVVATCQGVPLLDRPPMHYWMLAAIHRWIHELDPFTVRMTMVVVTALTALAVWWYARRFLSESAALIAGVAYPTLGHVTDLGRRGETDGVFTLLLGAAFFVWHAGQRDRWRPVVGWTAGCALAAAATLTKGLQGAIVFYAGVYGYLLLRREWRGLLRWSHLAGLVVFFGLIAIWQVPFWERVGWDGTRATWFDPLTSRVSERDFWDGLKRFVKFPISTFGALLPWSVLLASLPFRPFREWAGGRRECTTFMLVVVAVVFVPVWLSGGGLRRYAMPMYPAVAVLCGAVVERAMTASPGALRLLWRGFVRVFAWAFPVAIAGFAIATAVGPAAGSESLAALAQPWWLLAAMAVLAAAAVPVALRLARSDRLANAGKAGAVVALMFAAVFGGPVENARAYGTVRVADEVAGLRPLLPADVRLYSFGRAHTRLVYAYGQPIESLPMPATADELPADLEYFVLTYWFGDEAYELPFEWEQVATLNMDRRRRGEPKSRVVVGRRVRG